MEQTQQKQPNRTPLRRRTMIVGDTFIINGREWEVNGIAELSNLHSPPNREEWLEAVLLPHTHNGLKTNAKR